MTRLLRALAAFSLFAISLSAQEGDRNQAIALMASGNTLSAQKTPEALHKAAANFLEAAALWQKLNEPSQQSQGLQNAALMHFPLHELAEMSTLLDQAATVEQADPTVKANLLVSYSVLHNAQGEYRKAIADLEQARGIYKTLNDHISELRMGSFQGTAFQMIGNTQTQAGDLGAATASYLKALALFQESGNTRLAGQSFVRLGQLSYQLRTPEAFRQAADYFTQAIPLMQSASDHAGEAIAWQGLADSRDSLGQYEPARDAYLKALPLVTDPKTQGRLLKNAGIEEDNLGHVTDAVVYYQRALPLTALAHDEPTQFIAGMKLAMAYQKLGRTTESLAAYADVVAACQAANDISGQAVALSGIGVTQLKARNWQASLDAFTAEQKIQQKLGDKEAESRSWNSISSVYSSRGEYRLKLDADQRALALLDGSKDRVLRTSALQAVGDSYSSLHNAPKALEFLAKALELAENPTSKALILDEIGEVHYNQSELDQALQFEKQALDIVLPLNLPQFANRISTDIGLTYQAQGEKAKAQQIFENTLAEARKENNLQQQYTSLHNLGNLYQSFGDNQQAEKLFSQSLELAQKDGERKQAAVTLSYLGMAYHALAREDEAMKALRQSMSEMHALDDSYGESVALNNLSLVYSDLGRAQEALDTQNQAVALLRGLSDEAGVAAQLRNLGGIYQGLGDYTSAEAYFKEALELQEHYQDEHAQANTHNSLGVLAVNAGNPSGAIREFETALPILQKFGDRAAETILLSNMANASIAAGERKRDEGNIAAATELFKAAVSSEQQALISAREIHNLNDQALALHGLGSAYESSGDLQKARESLQQARVLWHDLRNLQAEARANSVLAKIERKQGHVDDALREADAAIKILDTQRGALGSEDLRAYYLASIANPYQIKIDLLMTNHNDRLAFEASERSRARSLMDLLAQSHAGVRRGVDPVLLAQERSIENSISYKAVRLVSATGAEAKQLQVEIEDLTAARERVEARIRVNSPVYAALTQPQSLNLPQIQQQVLDRDTVLLEYSFGVERSFLFLVTSTSLTSYVLPKQREIAAAADEFSDKIKAGSQDRAALQATGSKLSHLLLDPIAKQIQGRRLVIVGDGELCGIPFAALPEPRSGLPLIVNHEIVTQPSASALAVLRREMAGRKPAPKQVAVIADPVFEAKDARFQSRPDDKAATADLIKTSVHAATRGKDFLERLPHTREEADAILALTTPEKSLALLDFDANKAAVLGDRLAGYRIVHFATHGAVDDTHPQLSGLALSLYDRSGHAVDGFLRLNDIFDMKLTADLVVLSACQSGQGKLVAGEGLLGLTRGFFFAGTPSLVISLWNVDDNATGKLMGRFYQEMLASPQKRPAAALRAAQRWMISQAELQDPYLWAAFTIQGEWR